MAVPPQSPSMADVLLGALDARLDNVHTAMPGRVESYDASTQTCSVQPLVERAYYDEAGDRQTERLPVVRDCPVVFPGAGAYAITFPVAAGDVVLLVFASCSLDRWSEVGGEVDPGDDRRHSLSDAIAIPGLRPRSAPISSAPTSALVVHADEIRLGSADADDPVIRKSDLDVFIANYNNHRHMYVSPASPPEVPTGVATTQQSAIAGSPNVSAD